MKNVLLYGHLAARFGRKHRLAVSSPGEAIRALCANFKGFRAHLLKHNQPGYKVLAGKVERGEAELQLDCSADTIRIVPIVAGAGGGFGKVLLGAALIGASFFLPGTTYFSAMSSFSINASAIASGIGFSLVLGGVSQMLFAPPKARSSESEAANNRPSYAFNGAVNTVAQGNPVALCYGEMIVGSQVISTGLSVEQVPV